MTSKDIGLITGYRFNIKLGNVAAYFFMLTFTSGDDICKSPKSFQLFLKKNIKHTLLSSQQIENSKWYVKHCLAHLISIIDTCLT